MVKESGMSFSENVVLDFRTLTDIDITNREALARENRCVLNILCIKLFTKLSRQEFIRIFKALYPTLDLEILHKVLKLYLIAHNQMNLQNEHLINAVKKVLGLDIFALRCASPRSSFLVDMRSRLQITQQELHAAIYTMEVDFSLDQDNVVPLFDELESTLSSAPEF